jgi:hypothetical protein
MIFFAMILSDKINWSPPLYIKDAVPNLTSLPPEVIGLLVPALCPASAVDKFPLLSPVIGLLVPGLMKPDIGLPAFDIGLILCDIPPG